MSETNDGRVGLCSTFWQRSDDGAWISDGGRDTADPDEFQAALALIDRLARELREAKEWRLGQEEREAACCPEDVGFPEYIATLKAEVARLRKALERYGYHLSECLELWPDKVESCTCGLTAALAPKEASDGR